MFIHTYDSIITVENLLLTWERFLRGKRNKKDVVEFQLELGKNLLSLHQDLKNKTYAHGGYVAFNVSDPKPRNIHKATVRDREVHHLLHKELYWYFHVRFIHDSYSCRIGKGTHRALDRFKDFAREVSKNHKQPCYVLKCDIKKFFASIDQATLARVLERHIADPDIRWLIGQVVMSFHTTKQGIGLPLGNLTSQLLVNIYMHEFDMFVKQELKVRYYIRYADDFVLLSGDKMHLEELLLKIDDFLHKELQLTLHEHKVYIKNFDTGVDFLGWVHFPHHRVLRTATKRRVIQGMKGYPRKETIISYAGLLSHGNTHKIQKRLGVN